LFFFLKTGSHYEAQLGLKLAGLLSSGILGCWVYSRESLGSVGKVLIIVLNIKRRLGNSAKSGLIFILVI
jgi:hypothetical protein